MLEEGSEAPYDLENFFMVVEVGTGNNQVNRIGIGMAALVVVLAVAVEVMSAKGVRLADMAETEVSLFRYVLLGITVTEFFLIKIIRAQVLAATNPKAEALPPEKRFWFELPKLMVASFIMLFLCEAISLYGFVLFILSANTTDYYIFAAMSFIAFVIYFPKYNHWEESMRAKLSQISQKPQ